MSATDGSELMEGKLSILELMIVLAVECII